MDTPPTLRSATSTPRCLDFSDDPPPLLSLPSSPRHIKSASITINEDYMNFKYYSIKNLIIKKGKELHPQLIPLLRDFSSSILLSKVNTYLKSISLDVFEKILEYLIMPNYKEFEGLVINTCTPSEFAEKYVPVLKTCKVTKESKSSDIKNIVFPVNTIPDFIAKSVVYSIINKLTTVLHRFNIISSCYMLIAEWAHATECIIQGIGEHKKIQRLLITELDKMFAVNILRALKHPVTSIYIAYTQRDRIAIATFNFLANTSWLNVGRYLPCTRRNIRSFKTRLTKAPITCNPKNIITPAQTLLMRALCNVAGTWGSDQESVHYILKVPHWGNIMYSYLENLTNIESISTAKTIYDLIDYHNNYYPKFPKWQNQL